MHHSHEQGGKEGSGRAGGTLEKKETMQEEEEKEIRQEVFYYFANLLHREHITFVIRRIF